MYTKYPRTYHLPWSLGRSSDDKVLQDISHFIGKRVVCTVKMDGENTTLYSNGYTHARSIDSRGGVDRDWVKTMWANIAHNLPPNWRVCGENLWAKHSIYYENLSSYFMAFSVWDDNNFCLAWGDTLEYLNLLGLVHTKVIYDDIWDETKIRNLHETLDLTKDEGFVIRLAEKFHYDNFTHSVAKFVRQSHIQTSTHWRHTVIVPNKLEK